MFSPRSKRSFMKKINVEAGTPGMIVARARPPFSCLSRHRTAGSE
jgi:hypothetical protein